MFREHPRINTPLEAVDELADLSDTLDGLSDITLALSTADVDSKRAIGLLSVLLSYCAETARCASRFIPQGEGTNIPR